MGTPFNFLATPWVKRFHSRTHKKSYACMYVCSMNYVTLSLCMHIIQAVPAYIQKVNWGSLLETLEVYSLLEEIHDTKDKFPAEVN